MQHVWLLRTRGGKEEGRRQQYRMMREKQKQDRFNSFVASTSARKDEENTRRCCHCHQLHPSPFAAGLCGCITTASSSSSKRPTQIMFKPQVEGRTQRQRHGRRSLGPMTPRTRTRATIVGLLITDLCRCQPVKIVFAVDRDLLAIHARMGGGPGVGSGDWRIDDLAKHKYEHVSHSLVFEVFQCCLRAQSAKGLARKQVRRAMQYLQNLYISAHAHFRIASTTTASTCVFVFIIIILGLFGFVHPTDAILHSSCLTI